MTIEEAKEHIPDFEAFCKKGLQYVRTQVLLPSTL